MRNAISISLVAALTGLGCLPSSSPIRIRGVTPIGKATPDTDCALDVMINTTTGRLDPSGGGDFVVVLNIDSELTENPEIINERGVQLTTPGKRNYVIEQIALGYRFTERPMSAPVTFENETIPVYFEILPNSEGNKLATDIIGDKAATRLRNMAVDPTVESQLLVTIQTKGRTASGDSLASNPITFPITVQTSDTQCPEPGNVTFTGPCGTRGGQEGYPFTCCVTGMGMPNCPN